MRGCLPRMSLRSSGLPARYLFNCQRAGHQLAFPRRGTHPSCCPNYPPKTKGAGKAGCSPHPQPRTQTKKRTSVVTTGSPKQSDLPCAMVYGLFRALPGDRAFLPPSLADRSANLTPASGRRDHTALPSATASFVLRHQSVHRIPHPTFVTIAKRPLCPENLPECANGRLWTNRPSPELSP